MDGDKPDAAWRQYTVRLFVDDPAVVEALRREVAYWERRMGRELNEGVFGNSRLDAGTSTKEPK